MVYVHMEGKDSTIIVEIHAYVTGWMLFVHGSDQLTGFLAEILP